jgi:hypothetical protein
MPRLPQLDRAQAAVFLVAFGCATVFALFTQHAWEDYYITFRASKNLAMGNGLVFNVGDRLHTFTSPLGVLLPAACSLLTLNSSDAAALWLFRVVCSVAFGVAAILLFSSVRRASKSSAIPAVLTVGWLCTDAKSVDFTINGMETGFILLFIAYTLWALFTAAPNRRWLHLGFAWAGLMWTRPDSFIYIGLIAAGAWLFNDPAQSQLTRRQWLGVFLKAGGVCTAVYLPWFTWAWLYYGSPVPHTIVAKASVSASTWTFAAFVEKLLSLPQLAWKGASTFDSAFLPTYYIAGGWPHAIILSARFAGIVTACLWFLPFVRSETRTASFAFLGAHIYLTFFPYFPFPWYLPPTALLAFYAWGCLSAQVLAWARITPGLLRSCVVLTLGLVACGHWAVQSWLLQASAKQMAALQEWIDTGNRRTIGEWLAKRAEPGDRVFLEPLGYIGFFSGLKTYDWPGLSSREVVEAHAKLGSNWSALVDYLGPDWLVLRPREVEEMERQAPYLLSGTYEKVRDFDVRQQVQQLDVHGRELLALDAIFTVYHRKTRLRYPAEPGKVESLYPGSSDGIVIDNVLLQMIHAPGSVRYNIPEHATHVRVAYAFGRGAADAEPMTDGARFVVIWTHGNNEQVLHDHQLDPAAHVEDRAVFFFDGALPADSDGTATLILRSVPGITDTKDWTCWGKPEFR